jgi:peptidoglycan hydrolase-like protein with peptidoglycan-binding domain
MRAQLATALIAIVVLLVGCTDAPGTAAAGDDAGRQPDSTTTSESEQVAGSELPAASETSENDDAASEEPSEASEPPQDAPDEDAGDDEASPPEKPNKPRLTAAKPDDQGDEVDALQKRLDKLGFAPGPIDGAYGPQTQAAVEAFQMLAGLEQTGTADARTVAALEDFQVEGPVLKAGDKGRAVKRLQRRLDDGPFDPGPVDGEYGGNTVQAVWALEKLAGVPVDGNWGPLDEYAWEQLENGEAGEPAKKHKKRWVEVDLSQQLVKVYDAGSTEPFLVSHASSGSGIAWSNEGHSGSSVTPLGDFVISRRINGWRESSLDIGRLYNPLYFNGGIALHGALSVPLYPASHGCIRLPMHVADYLPGELPNGTPVHVLS